MKAWPRMRTPLSERIFAGHTDVLAALRSLRRSPMFVAIAVLSLGLAIGLNTTMLAMLDAVFHPYVPYPHPERLANLIPYGAPHQGAMLQREMYLAVKARPDLYAELVPYGMSLGNIQANGHLVARTAVRVGPDLFHAMGVQPVLGRVFNTSGNHPEDAHAAVISYTLWRQEFGGTSNLAAMNLTVDGKDYTVIGVMPAGVAFPTQDVWLALPTSGPEATPTGFVHGLLVLKPGDTRARVKAQLAAMATQIAADYHSSRVDFDYRLQSMAFGGPRPTGETYLVALITLMVLAVACLNLANLMLARGLSRRRELAVRMAIGAGRMAIVRHVLTECAVIAALGGAWGILLSIWGVKLAQADMPGLVRKLGFSQPHMSWHILVIGLLVTGGTVLVAGLAPAFHAAGANVGDAIKDGGGSSTGTHSRLYRLVVVGEIAVALGVAIFSTFSLTAYARQANVRFGYDAGHVLESSVLVDPRCKTQPGGSPMPIWTDMAQRLAAVPGVRAAALYGGANPLHNVVTSDQPGAPEERVLGKGMVLGYVVTTPDYFRVYNYPIVAGRNFTAGDGDSAGVAIVNRELAAELWPFVSPVGRLLKLGASHSNAPWVRVVGVVGSRLPATDSTDDSPLLTVVRPVSCYDATVALRTSGPTGGVGTAAYHVLKAATPPAGYVAEFRSARAEFEDSLRFLRLITVSLVSCGLFALLLSAVGVFGVLSYAVGQRTREFAMRVALGAPSPHLAGIVLRNALELVLGGTALGGSTAVVLLTPTMRGTGSLDFALVLTIAEAVIVVACLAACINPVRRALRSDPVELLRST